MIITLSLSSELCPRRASGNFLCEREIEGGERAPFLSYATHRTTKVHDPITIPAIRSYQRVYLTVVVMRVMRVRACTVAAKKTATPPSSQSPCQLRLNFSLHMMPQACACTPRIESFLPLAALMQEKGKSKRSTAELLIQHHAGKQSQASKAVLWSVQSALYDIPVSTRPSRSLAEASEKWVSGGCVFVFCFPETQPPAGTRMGITSTYTTMNGLLCDVVNAAKVRSVPEIFLKHPIFDFFLFQHVQRSTS